MQILQQLATKAQRAISDETTLDLIERGATKAAYVASGATVVSGLTINEWGVIVGMIGVGITTGFNVWFKMKYGRGERNE